MIKLFKISEAVDVEGRLPYKNKYYIGLKPNHYKPFLPGGRYLILTDSGREFVKNELGIEWNGYYSLDECSSDELDKLRHNYEIVKNISNGTVNSGEILK